MKREKQLEPIYLLTNHEMDAGSRFVVDAMHLARRPRFGALGRTGCAGIMLRLDPFGRHLSRVLWPVHVFTKTAAKLAVGNRMERFPTGAEGIPALGMIPMLGREKRLSQTAQAAWPCIHHPEPTAVSEGLPRISPTRGRAVKRAAPRYLSVQLAGIERGRR
jgi:hypothetical protein